ncbi:MAG TPA: chemotaxis protein CheB [Vicinamibacterales bacterium]|nr:chemotaxis protein CheB [Vicinamibacterales bacterium]
MKTGSLVLDSDAVRSLPPFKIVVIGASAGGLAALGILLARLATDFPVPIAVVQHLDPHRQSQLADILSRRTTLIVKEAVDADAMAKGTVYIAPPGHHLLISRGCVATLTETARVHFVRPSVDRLFESAADSCGPAIAVVLTGTGADGAGGLAAIKRTGGITIAQNLASFPGMPQSAIDTGLIDFILPLEDIGARLSELTRWS